MRERERDDLPLDELRRAWRGLEPAAPAEDLEQADAKTRAVVDWMRDAWTGLEVPAPRVPLAPRPRALPRLAAGLAAAAAVLAALWLVGNEQPLQRPAELVRSEGEGPTTRSTAEGPQLASLSAEHIELRSGPVRLILLKDQRPQ